MNSIAEWISGHAAVRPDKVAIRFEGEEITYGALEERVRAAARLLGDELGLERGERIGYLGYNTPDQIILTFAAARAGIMLVPVNWRLAVPEQAYILQNAGARALFVQQALAGNVDEIVRVIGGKCPVFGIDFPPRGAGWYASHLHEDHLPDIDIGRQEDPLLLVYTSGTTGHPKGAILSQQAVAYNALNSAHMHDLGENDHVLTVLPMFHVGGLNIQTLPALRAGATVTLHQRFDPAATLAAIASDRPTLTVQVPATMQALIAHPAWDTTDLSCLRAVATGSTDVPLPLIRAFHARGVPVIQVYGSTETGPCTVYQRTEEAFATEGSIGRAPLHGEVRILRPDGSEAAAGEAGEICVRGPHVATGYWRDEIKTAESFRGGWFHSGDIAARDETGLYWFRDRSKNVIISGGENVYPAELERILRDVPGIAEATVVGVPDSRWGQVPVAVVVRSADAAELAEGDVLAAFAGQLARYKHPKRVVFVPALPRNVMGKVIPDEARKLAAAAGTD